MQSDDIDSTIERVRARVTAKTLIQDVSEPLTGELDPRRVAGKITNLESAVSDLADAVETLDEKIETQSGTPLPESSWRPGNGSGIPR